MDKNHLLGKMLDNLAFNYGRHFDLPVFVFQRILEPLKVPYTMKEDYRRPICNIYLDLYNRSHCLRHTQSVTLAAIFIED